MSNTPLTLPLDVDNFLMDLAQMYGMFDYTDISTFAQSTDKSGIKLLREHMANLADLEYEIEEDDEAKQIFDEIVIMIKGDK